MPRSTKKAKPRGKTTTKTLYQFKVTLRDSKPPIWRRIQVYDCTLDKLHEHIQAAMGWTNSHLNQFEIDGVCYGNPKFLDGGYGDLDLKNSLKTRLSDILCADDKKFRFRYEYDFGDSWLHEIVFEGCPEAEPGQKYPRCVDGKLACPPEDVGGIWGYYGFLEAIANPKHRDHEMYIEWAGEFDAEQFSAVEATESMKQGVPKW